MYVNFTSLEEDNDSVSLKSYISIITILEKNEGKNQPITYLQNPRTVH